MKTLKEMNMKMMMILGALMLSLTVSAVEFQTYRPSGRQAGYSVYTTATTSRPQGTDFRSTSRYGAYGNSNAEPQEQGYRGIGGISTIPAISGNGTAYNPGASNVAGRGPRRSAEVTNNGHTHIDEDHDGYCDYSEDCDYTFNAGTGNGSGSVNEGDMIPIGSPVWPLLLLAVAYGAVATLRRYRRRET